MTKTPSGRYASNDPLPTIEACGWEPLSGYQFKEWNVNQDGSGLSFQPGDTISGGSPGFENDKYAIWEPIPVPYLVMSTDLTAVADAIRENSGTSAALEWPDGFVDAISPSTQSVTYGNRTRLYALLQTEAVIYPTELIVGQPVYFIRSSTIKDDHYVRNETTGVKVAFDASITGSNLGTVEVFTMPDAPIYVYCN